MESTVSKSFKDRLNTVGISGEVFAALTGMHTSDVSRHGKGFRVAPARAAHMESKLVELEDLVASVAIRPDMTSVSNIKAAIAKLTEIRAKKDNEESAIAPWQSRGAVAAYGELPRGGNAGEILSEVGATDSQQ